MQHCRRSKSFLGILGRDTIRRNPSPSPLSSLSANLCLLQNGFLGQDSSTLYYSGETTVSKFANAADFLRKYQSLPLSSTSPSPPTSPHFEPAKRGTLPASNDDDAVGDGTFYVAHRDTKVHRSARFCPRKAREGPRPCARHSLL